jgi:aminoglycoside phosphotransferase (APT) family kinase protein
MYSPSGITGVVDWEMAHLGDPHEDLAWALLPDWRSGSQPNKIMEFLEPEEAIGIWEKARGLKCDHNSLHWWTVFSHVKACAIWAKARCEFASNPNSPLVYGFVSLTAIDVDEVMLLEEMGVASR